MRIDVQILGDRALLEYTPHIAARILFGAESFDRYAVRRGNVWTWDDSGELVPVAVALALSHASRS